MDMPLWAPFKLMGASLKLDFPEVLYACNCFLFVKCESCSAVSLFATPWTVACQVLLSMNFAGNNTGVSSHSLLQGIFSTQGSNPDLPHCRQILYHLSHQYHFCLTCFNCLPSQNTQQLTLSMQMKLAP